MVTLLEILDQSMSDNHYRLVPGLKIGRSRGDILIKDPNISSLHAVVELDEGGNLVISDLGSSNGLIINNKKVNKIRVLSGITFQIGKTLFRIKEVDELEAERLAPRATPREMFFEEMQELLSDELPISPIPPQFFSSLVNIEVVGGVDLGKNLHLSYGPRTVGYMNIDIALRDPNIPAVAFEIREGSKGLELVCKDPQVLLNGQHFGVMPIATGDLVQMGTTQLKFNLKAHAQ